MKKILPPVWLKYIIVSILTVPFFVIPLRANEVEINLVPQVRKLENRNKLLPLPVKPTVYVQPDCGLSKHYISHRFAALDLVPVFAINESKAAISFLVDSIAIPEADGYKMGINAANGRTICKVVANSSNGLRYALATLHQLISKGNGKSMIAACSIYDFPAFRWRAFMLDEARHFQGADIVKELLDEMALLKMNVFHWHLVDDQGWRIDIKKYPLLTGIGSRSNFSLRHQGRVPPDIGDSSNVKWFYTQEEIRALVAYAADRGITVVPEIEVPGHASASLTAYPWLGTASRTAGKPVYHDLYNVTDPAVEQFLFDVIDEVIDLFPSRLVHIGGDEADHSHWRKDSSVNRFMRENKIPTCMDLQLWSVNRFSKHINSRGARMIGWNEITGDNIRNEAHVEKSELVSLAPGTIVQFWDGDISLVNKAIARGFEVINSNRFFTYLDYNYESTPLERVYSFNLVPEGVNGDDRKKILGSGAQMWGEFTPTKGRLYFQVFPRIAALAENGWVEPSLKGPFSDFSKRLAPTENRWKELGFIREQAGKY